MKNNQTKSRSLVLAVSALSLLASTVSYADFGISADIQKIEEYKNTDKDGLFLLGLEYRGDKFNMNKGLSYDFTNSNKYAVEALLTSKHYGFEAKHSDTFTGMDRRHTSIDLGGRVIVDTQVGPAVFDVTKDLNSSKGYEAKIKLGGIAPHAQHWTGERKVTISPVVGVHYQSAKVVDYYYGVKNSEATANRKAYKGKSAVTPFIGLEGQANITPHFSIDAGVGLSKRAKSVRNSPITDSKKYEVGANIGFTYWF